MPEPYRVFLSSTAADLDAWRTAVHRALDQMDGVRVVWMKDWVAHPATSMQVCEDKVRDSHVFVGLVGHCFGSAPETHPDRSYTMLEYDWAIEAGLPPLLHRAPGTFTIPADLIEDERRRTLQKAFREEISGRHAGQRESWENPDRLAADVAEAVRQQIVRMQAARQPGFTLEKHEVSLLDRLNELALAIGTAPPEQAPLLRAERGEIEAKLRDLEGSFDGARARIAELEALLEREGNHLGAERLERAETALAAGDFDEADALLAEIEADEDLAVQRAARAAYGRGQIAEEQVRWADAAEHYDKAARLAPSYDNLNKAQQLYWRAGQHRIAARHAEDLVAFSRSEIGAEDPLTATALNNLGTIYNAMGRNAEAEPLYRQAMATTRAALGEAHPDYATRLNNLALLLQAMGRHAEAEPLFRQAIEIDKSVLGEAHPDYATDLNNLAALLQATGRYAEAEPLYRQAMATTRAALGEAHPAYATRLNNLAALLRATGRHAEAEPLYRQAMEIRKSALGEAHPDYAQSLNNLAALLQAMERYAEAEPLYRQAMEIRKATLGEAHPDYAQSLNNLAGLLQDTGRLAEAEPLYRQAIEIDKATIGEAHPDHASHLNNLALLLRATDRHAEARPLFAEMMPILRKALGDDHPNTQAGAANYASLLREHAPDDPALAELEAAFGPEVGR